MRNYENYALGSWIKGEGDGTPLYNAINGEQIGTATSKGLDFSQMMDYAREKGGRALRKMTFQESGFSVVVEDKVISRLGSELTVAPYGVIERNGINETEGGFLNPENFAYLGPVFSTQDDVYEKYFTFVNVFFISVYNK